MTHHLVPRSSVSSPPSVSSAAANSTPSSATVSSARRSRSPNTSAFGAFLYVLPLFIFSQRPHRQAPRREEGQGRRHQGLPPQDRLSLLLLPLLSTTATTTKLGTCFSLRGGIWRSQGGSGCFWLSGVSGWMLPEVLETPLAHASLLHVPTSLYHTNLFHSCLCRTPRDSRHPVFWACSEMIYAYVVSPYLNEDKLCSSLAPALEINATCPKISAYMRAKSVRGPSQIQL